MVKLFERQPKRFFAFGCSFTDYRWASWANILAYELKVPFYNFGCSGAGNYYIANQVAQADAKYNFTKDDLVIVCWTNVSREDRWVEYKKQFGWLTPGNIYTQDEYDKKFVARWANHTHFAMRDFSMIHLVDTLLSSKTQYHHLQMLDLANKINQWENNNTVPDTHEIDSLKKTFKLTLDKLLPSFYEVLWNGDVQNKWEKDWKEVHRNFSDGHPTMLEHFEYLQKTFDHEFTQSTHAAVEQTYGAWVQYIREGFAGTTRAQGIYNLPQKWQDTMHKKFQLQRSYNMPDDIIH